MQKPILCIVPGWDGSRETWQKFIVSAEKDFDVHCIELPGFGGVDTPHTVWGVEQYGEYVFLQLAEIRKEHTEAKIILLGHSFGGQVAAYVAEWHADSFDELVLVAAAIVRPKRRIKRVIFGSAAKIVKFFLHTTKRNTRTSELKRKMYNAIFSPDYADTSGIKREIFKKVIREDMQESLQKINKNVLIFWGKHDSYTPIRFAKRIANKLKKSELVVFPDGKHGLHHTHGEVILTKLKERYTKD